jgi:hypothetical protein
MATVNGYAIYTSDDNQRYNYYGKRDNLTAGGGTPKDGPDKKLPYLRAGQARTGKGLKPRIFRGRSTNGKTISIVVATKSKGDQLNTAGKITVKGVTYTGGVSDEIFRR